MAILRPCILICESAHGTDETMNENLLGNAKVKEVGEGILLDRFLSMCLQ